MNIGNNDKDSSLKKAYCKPTVDSCGLKLGLYGDYGRDDSSHGGNTNSPGANQGKPVRNDRFGSQGF
jgi:hypothetical protein